MTVSQKVNKFVHLPRSWGQRKMNLFILCIYWFDSTKTGKNIKQGFQITAGLFTFNISSNLKISRTIGSWKYIFIQFLYHSNQMLHKEWICHKTAGLQRRFRSIRPEVFCKKVFLKISQNSQESTCARVSFLIKLRAIFFIEHLWWLLL